MIGRCFECLRNQRGQFELDVVVVDSGSTDSTLEIARTHEARIVEISPGDFDYSKALNVGIQEARGEIVVSISAHAIPVGHEWLERMIAPFEDNGVAGVSCRQVPWPNAPWREVQRLRDQFGESGCVYRRYNREEILFSNAASAIRRAVWIHEPFTLPAVEDLDWAQRVVELGWSIVYEPRAAVYHSHHENAREQARRLIDINRVYHTEAGANARRRTLREAAGLFVRDSRSILKLDEPLGRKLGHLAELVRVAGYYVVDFSRSGTTAERRREDARSSSDLTA